MARRFRFPGPVPKEALEFFRAKGIRPSFSYLDVSSEEHALNFTVAKSTGFDILADVKAALAKHLDGGGTLRTFSRELTPILQKKGWWGVREVEDPQTGETVTAQLGSPRRLRTIFRANMRSARAAGQWARIQRTKASHPYLLYRLGPSREHRDEHVAWDGTLLPADDGWWADHFPPNGWGCKCWVRQVSRREAERLGGVTEAPERNPVEWTNPRTGRRMLVDGGLDPSWASNPGLDRERILAADTIAKLAALPEGLGRAAVREFVDGPQLERQLAGQGSADLAVGWLELRWRSLFTGPVETRVLRLPARIAEKQAKRPEVRLADYRRIEEVLGDARYVVHQSEWRDPQGVTHKVDDLVFVTGPPKKPLRLVVRRHDSRNVSLITWHRIRPKQVDRIIDGGEIVAGIQHTPSLPAGES